MKYHQERMGRHYSMGVDLGQRTDHTVIAVVEGVVVQTGKVLETPYGGITTDEDHFDIVHLARLPLGTPWSTIIEEIVTVAYEYQDPAYFHVDVTGLGGPVFEQLHRQGREHGLRGPRGITFTAKVKADIVGTLEILIDERRLHAAPGIPLGRDFADELRTFGYSITDAGNVSYNAKGSAHDDFIAAVGLAVYPYAFRRRLPHNARRITLTQEGEMQ